MQDLLKDISLFDITVISLMVLLGLKGLFRGFIKEIFGIIGIVGGVFVASRIAKDAGTYIDGIFKLDNESVILLAGFVSSLVIFWTLAYMLGMIISKMSDMSGLGVFDKLFGFIFGTGKIFLIFSIIVYALSQVEAINEKLEQKVGNTITYPILKKSGASIVKLDTSGLVKKIEKSVDGTVKTTKEVIKKDLIKEAKEKAQQYKEEASKKIKEVSGENK